jgi:hypothetical protein
MTMEKWSNEVQKSHYFSAPILHHSNAVDGHDWKGKDGSPCCPKKKTNC